MEDAKRRFDELAIREPKLSALWIRCRCATPPLAANDESDDSSYHDAYDVDSLSPDRTDGWCAEDWFGRTIKPEFEALVGWLRPDCAPELSSPDVYDDIYAALFHHALNRNCACCSDEIPQRLRA